ncbi:hypothetical protein HK405_010646, partial [Cladochytrium tenue]
MPITKVALAGASGQLGAAVLTQLLAAGFQVTALTRAAGRVQARPGVTEVVVDFGDRAALAAALVGHHAVVATTSGQAAAAQILLADAAADAGVTRFVPSEFGSDLDDPESRSLPVYADKIKVREHLAGLAASGALSYSILINNAFLDWGLQHKFLLDPVAHSATLWDGGDDPISFTSLPAVGRAVVGILQHPDETKNRVVRVQEVAVSFKELVAVAKEVTPGKEWTVVEKSTKEAAAKSFEALGKGVFEGWVWVGFIYRAAFRPGAGHLAKNDNELVGVKELSREELKAIVLETFRGIPGA